MTTSTMTDTKKSFLEFDNERFRSDFPDRAFKITHHLDNLPELQLPRLAELAQRLSRVEYYAGDVGVSQTIKTYPRTGLSAVETVRRIEECKSWMVLWNIQEDPEYNALVKGILAQWYDQLDARQRQILGSMRYRERGFLFVSSPNAVTPFHCDDEHNFLLQIRGSKKVSLFDVKDRMVMPEPMAEKMLQSFKTDDPNYERYIPYEDGFQSRATEYWLAPGEGLHFPYGAPHWIQNGPAVSISLSITFCSEFSDRLGKVYYMNRRVRKLGVNPTPPDQSGWRDSLKMSAFDVARRASRVVKRKPA